MTHALERIPVSRRLLLIAVSFSVPVAVMLWLIVTGMNQDIAFARAEREGVQYLAPLSALLDGISAHQVADDEPAEAAKAAAAIDKALGELDAVQSELGESLQFTPEGLAKRHREHFSPATLRSEWTALEAGWTGLSAAENDARHEHLIEDVRGMIAHAGDTSNLILDPDLDSYYVMDAVVVGLPGAQARLGRVNTVADNLLAHTTTLADMAEGLAVQAAMLKENDGDRVKGDVQTALNEDAGFNGVSPTLRAQLGPATDQYVQANDAVIQAIRTLLANPKADASALDKAGHEARAAAAAAVGAASRELDTLLAARMSRLQFERMEAVGVSLAILGLALGLVYAIARSISGPLARTTADLTEGARQVIATSEQVAAASQGLSQGATEQASSIEETSASMEEMASMTRKNAENTREASILVAEVHQRVHDSQDALGDMVQSMTAIQESSQKVSKIIKTIDEIAFQTNILALNAAVEAARAGEAGMGFAVVADEVRSLAQRSAQAAKDTADLIEESINRSRTGSTKVEVVATAITGITTAVNRVKGLVEEVAEASQQQAQGLDQVTQALNQMEKVTQTTAATAEESAATSEELHAQAEITMDAIQHLTSMVGGSADKAATPVSRRTAPKGAGVKLPFAAKGSKPAPAPKRSAEEEFPLGATGTFGQF
ncbi:MAG: methyl-accepting chemotaxis protein [Vicinamibacterales bacterium]